MLWVGGGEVGSIHSCIREVTYFAQLAAYFLLESPMSCQFLEYVLSLSPSLFFQSYDTSTSSTRAEKHLSAPPHGDRSRQCVIPPPTNGNLSHYAPRAKSIQVSNSRDLCINPHEQLVRINEVSYRLETRRRSPSLLRSDCTDRYKPAILTGNSSSPSQQRPPSRMSTRTSASHVHLSPEVSAVRRNSTYHSVTNSPKCKRLSGSGTHKSSFSTKEFYSVIPDLKYLEPKPHPQINADSNAPLLARKPIQTNATKRIIK